MMRIAVCDDNSNHLQTIKDRILKLGKELETDFIIDSYADGSDLIAKTEILLDNYYSIIVFDIEMKEMGGIQAADILREKGWKTTRFIFISSHTTYFKTLCDLEISAFVEKIELNECFNEKFLRVYNRLGSNEKVYFTYSENKLMKNIKLQDINYFEGKDREDAAKAEQDYEYWKSIKFYSTLENEKVLHENKIKSAESAKDRAKKMCEKMAEYDGLEEYKMVNTLLTVNGTESHHVLGTMLLDDSYHHVNTPDLQGVIKCLASALIKTL